MLDVESCSSGCGENQGVAEPSALAPPTVFSSVSSLPHERTLGPWILANMGYLLSPMSETRATYTIACLIFLPGCLKGTCPTSIPSLFPLSVKAPLLGQLGKPETQESVLQSQPMSESLPTHVNVVP